MIRNFCLSSLFLTILFTLSACDDDSSGNSTPIEGNGSCTTTQNGEQVCYEVEEDYSSLKFECNIFGGSWSPSACNTDQYARRCVQETEVSEDNENTWTTVHYIYYFEADSTTACVGDETDL